jgi:hypothetical protein
VEVGYALHGVVRDLRRSHDLDLSTAFARVLEDATALFENGAGQAMVVVLLTALLSRRAVDPAPDRKEWTGRVVAALMAASYLVWYATVFF